MAKNASDFLVERLYAWGIRRVFAFPGDGINGVMEALNRFGKIDFVQARHEEEAAFMACGHAKFTGEIGVCIATSGPGAIHLLNGLYDAKLDRQPVLAIVGQQASFAMGADFQQEVDLVSLFKDVAGEYVQMASNPYVIRQLVDRSIRIARAERNVTCIIVPNDVQEMPAAERPPRTHGCSFTGIGYVPPKIVPTDEELHRAADILNAGKKVAILVGDGARDGAYEVMQTAELLGAGVAKALLGKDVLPDDIPYVTGPIGLLGSKPSWDMMMQCDTFLMIGSSFPYSEFLPKEGQARGVQIDIDGRMLSLRYPMEVGLEGDTRETLKLLIPHLQRKEDRSWVKKIEAGVAEWWKILDARAQHGAHPINPQRVFWELSPKLPDNCIVTCDSGSTASWYARDLKFRFGMRGSLSGRLATMCPGVPYATAAKFAYPDRPVIAISGDGAMQMLGNDGLITISKYWRQWKDPRLIIVVLRNRDLNQVTWEQRVFNGDPKYVASQEIPDMSYAAYAKLLGLDGVVVDDPQDIAGAWDVALNADRPFVFDAIADPNVPPLPPHINIKQAKGLFFALASGRDVDTKGIIIESVKEMAETAKAKV